MIRLHHAPLEAAFLDAFLAAGAVPDGARHVTASVVSTSLRGVDSHGIRLVPHYLRALRAGRVHKAPAIRVEQTGNSTAVVHADHAFGHHAGVIAMDAAAAAARAHGVGAAVVRDSTHFGAAAYFAIPPARGGLIAMSFTNADALVRAFGGTRSWFGTNPICVAAPMRDEEPAVLDMATSQVSWNKVLERRASGEPLPPEWAFDAQGQPTTDAQLATHLAGLGGYKGYGLGFVVELLCGFLADGPVATELLPMFTSPIEAQRRISHFFLAIDVGRFLPVDRFRARLQEMAQDIRTRADAQVPGDPEKRALVERSAHGIPVSDALYADLLAAVPRTAEARA